LISASTILLTGASGFLGQIINKELKHSYNIVSLSRISSGVSCDLSIDIPELPKADYVIHAAGKAHIIPKDANEIKEFQLVNYQGTVNLTKALEISGLPMALTYISSVAVYGVKAGSEINENNPLRGSTPYAKSKIAAEQYLVDWGSSNSVRVTILRLPLVASIDPPGNLGAMKKAIEKGYYFRLGVGNARKSMVWAADVAKIIPGCFETTGIFNITDGRDPTIRELDTAIGNKLNRKIKQLPQSMLNLITFPSEIFSFWPLRKDLVNKLTSSLTFSSEKAVQQLDWQPRSVIDCINEYGI
jgi:nucleoside-diphosphate-sugar epimerase